jgi:asparagine synthase (glutamine-hydrolysing)
VPTYLVSRLARADVTVSLSGDGGDELFAGYKRYALARAIWARLGVVPASVRRGLARVVRATPAPVLDVGLAWARPFIRRHGSDGRPSDKAGKIADLLDFRDARDVYLDLMSHFKDPAALVAGGTERSAVLDRWDDAPEGSTLTERMMYVDAVTYLPDDILVKVDRASMQVGLEARVPLLDHRVVEFAWSLPERLKVRDGRTKWALREVLGRHLPPALVDPGKTGFGVPIDLWLRGPLREWAEELLDPRRLARDGLLDPAPIRRMWDEHLSGRRDWHYYLWDVLMLASWKDAAGAAA